MSLAKEYNHDTLSTGALKYSLSNTAFCIPVFVDSNDRRENAVFVVDYLHRHFTDFHIYLYEAVEGDHPKLRYYFKDNPNRPNITYIFGKYYITDGIFDRCGCLNGLYSMAFNNFRKHPIIVNYDCDVFFTKEQYIESVEKILKGGAEMVYPYTRKVYEVYRSLIPRLRRSTNPANLIVPECYYRGENQFFIYRDTQVEDKEVWDNYGSCVFFDARTLILCGGENPNFIGWGSEDHERYNRFSKLGASIDRVDGCVFHLQHSRGVNSSKENPHYQNNEQEYRRIVEMSPQQIQNLMVMQQWQHGFQKHYFTMRKAMIDE